MINKKGQEELVGFVMIVIIVAVIFLVLLGIFVRQDFETSDKDSTEVFQFLEASMEFTTECAVGFEPDFSSLGELINDCYLGRKCVNEESACDVLNNTLENVLESSWNIDSKGFYKGYEFFSVYSTNSSEEKIIELEKGICDNSFIGAEYLSPSFPGVIVSSFKLCFG